MERHSVIIIGAGPGGLQTGYFLSKLNIDYLILEKDDSAGSFFKNYPITGKLISMNKVYTGSDNPEINLRMDWNSLLNDEGLLFTKYTDEFYPKAEKLIEYLNDFSKQLNIKYQCNVLTVDKNDKEYIINTDSGIYSCEKLIVATGMSHQQTKIPNYGNIGKEFFEDKEKFKGKHILIVGTGNSGFELANLLTPYAGAIILFGKNLKIASSTHYAGDVRSIYLPFIDTSFLKMQNFCHVSKDLEFNDDDFKYENGKYRYALIKRHEIALQEFDYIFFCTGFEFNDSIFNFSIEKEGNRPKLTEIYESTNNNNLYFVGTLMHSLDYKKGQGGFIHGFRYLIRYFVKNVFSNNDKFIFSSINRLIAKIFYRVNNDSGLFVMFGQFCDLFYQEDNNYIYIPFINREWIYKNKPSTRFITISFEFGMNEFDTFDTLFYGLEKPEAPIFIHPVFTEYNYINGKEQIKKYHCPEDDIGNFNKSIHRRFIHKYINQLFNIDKI